MRQRIDLTGQRFGRLVVLSLDEEKTARYKVCCWVCRCDCGNTTVVRSGSLRTGNTRSCGCGEHRFTKKASVEREEEPKRRPPREKKKTVPEKRKRGRPRKEKSLDRTPVDKGKFNDEWMFNPDIWWREDD